MDAENDGTFDTTNPFYQLLDKQAEEFELFGKRLKSEIQNSYREFTKQQKSTQKSQITNHEIERDAKPGEAFVVNSDGFSSQSELIDSLKARIEELETDSIIRNQDIEKQKSEIQQLKQELNKFKNVPEASELKRMKQEIEELNDFKINFMLLFDSFEQTKSEVNVMKSILQQDNVVSDRLLAEKLQFIGMDEDTKTSDGQNTKPSTSNLFSFKPAQKNNPFGTFPSSNNNIPPPPPPSSSSSSSGFGFLPSPAQYTPPYTPPSSSASALYTPPSLHSFGSSGFIPVESSFFNSAPPPPPPSSSSSSSSSSSGFGFGRPLQKPISSSSSSSLSSGFSSPGFGIQKPIKPPVIPVIPKNNARQSAAFPRRKFE